MKIIHSVSVEEQKPSYWRRFYLNLRNIWIAIAVVYVSGVILSGLFGYPNLF